MNWLRFVLRLPAGLIIIFVRIYQKCLSPFLGRTCRFHPSCSEYFVQAVRRDGLFIGGWKGIRRICRCHPWHPGGYDPP